jgi:hypothetical protein
MVDVIVTRSLGLGFRAILALLEFEHFTRARARPGRTLWGACDSLHTPRPLRPVHDIAQQTGSSLLERLEAGAPPRAIFSAVLKELRHRPPVIAVLEDLHWGDAATLDLVKFLGRRLIGDKVLGPADNHGRRQYNARARRPPGEAVLRRGPAGVG